MANNLLVTFNFDQLGEPREYRPPADRLIDRDIAIGDRVRILPNHACATGAQHRGYHVVCGSSDKVEAEWPRFGGWQ